MKLQIQIRKYFAALILIVLAACGYGQDYNLTLLGTLKYPGSKLANISTYVDSLGKEYALVCRDSGLSIVDISIPSAPTEKLFIPGPVSNWREVREYNGYAYVVSEGGGGLQVVDLHKLPSKANYTVSTSVAIQKAHTVFIDNRGILCVNGRDPNFEGTLFFDLNVDPINPAPSGRYSTNYVHDSYLRGETFFAAAIYEGFVDIVDISDRNAINLPSSVLAKQLTPGQFTHNVWLDSMGKYMFTSDEKRTSYLTCYDISNMNNITETDKILRNPDAILHNTYWMNDYCISSYYTEGITIHDVSRKHNLIEVGHYDTSPMAGGGYFGAWGVWPYLPSGNIVVSDMEEGLFVLKPTYKRACYLEGTVTDSSSGAKINKATIEILNKAVVDSTDITGNYATGLADAGIYTIRISKAGYESKIISNVALQNGKLTTLNIALSKTANASIIISVTDSLSGSPIPGAVLLFERLGGSDSTYFSNTSGQYTSTQFIKGNYTLTYGKWGYKTRQKQITIDNTSTIFNLVLKQEYYDDFAIDYKWKVSGTANKGVWVRDKPSITLLYINSYEKSNPDVDIENDLGRKCFVTGNKGEAAFEDQVSGGRTTLTSPVMNLKKAIDPYIIYHRWFFNSGTVADDKLEVLITDGTTSKIAETITSVDPKSTWIQKTLRIRDYFPQLTDSMHISFIVSDSLPNEDITEAGIDGFRVLEYSQILGIEDVNEPDKIVIATTQSRINKLSIEVKNADAKLPIYIGVYDIAGRVLYSGELQQNNTELQLSASSGMLLVKVQQGSMAVTKKCLWISN